MRSLIVLGLIAGMVVVAFHFLRAKHDRRFEVYEIATKLERGMSPAAVEQVLNDHWRPYMKRGGELRDGGGTIQVTAWFGRAEYLYLYIYFNNGKLVGTKMHGEDNPEDRYEDQPSDIPMTEEPNKALQPTVYRIAVRSG